MDYYSLTRRELQALCKKHAIPANLSNVAMADALNALVNVCETIPSGEGFQKQELSSEDMGDEFVLTDVSNTSRRSTRSKRHGISAEDEEAPSALKDKHTKGASKTPSRKNDDLTEKPRTRGRPGKILNEDVPNKDDSSHLSGVDDLTDAVTPHTTDNKLGRCRTCKSGRDVKAPNMRSRRGTYSEDAQPLQEEQDSSEREEDSDEANNESVEEVPKSRLRGKSSRKKVNVKAATEESIQVAHDMNFESVDEVPKPRSKGRSSRKNIAKVEATEESTQRLINANDESVEEVPNARPKARLSRKKVEEVEEEAIEESIEGADELVEEVPKARPKARLTRMKVDEVKEAAKEESIEGSEELVEEIPKARPKARLTRMKVDEVKEEAKEESIEGSEEYPESRPNGRSSRKKVGEVEEEESTQVTDDTNNHELFEKVESVEEVPESRPKVRSSMPKGKSSRKKVDEGKEATEESVQVTDDTNHELVEKVESVEEVPESRPKVRSSMSKGKSSRKKVDEGKEATEESVQVTDDTNYELVEKVESVEEVPESRPKVRSSMPKGKSLRKKVDEGEEATEESVQVTDDTNHELVEKLESFEEVPESRPKVRSSMLKGRSSRTKFDEGEEATEESILVTDDTNHELVEKVSKTMSKARSSRKQSDESEAATEKIVQWADVVNYESVEEASKTRPKGRSSRKQSDESEAVKEKIVQWADDVDYESVEEAPKTRPKGGRSSKKKVVEAPEESIQGADDANERYLTPICRRPTRANTLKGSSTKPLATRSSSRRKASGLDSVKRTPVASRKMSTSSKFKLAAAKVEHSSDKGFEQDTTEFSVKVSTNKNLKTPVQTQRALRRSQKDSIELLNADALVESTSKVKKVTAHRHRNLIQNLHQLVSLENQEESNSDLDSLNVNKDKFGHARKATIESQGKHGHKNTEELDILNEAPKEIESEDAKENNEIFKGEIPEQLEGPKEIESEDAKENSEIFKGEIPEQVEAPKEIESEDRKENKEICKEEVPDQVETAREIESEDGTENNEIFKGEVPEQVEAPKEIESVDTKENKKICKEEVPDQVETAREIESEDGTENKEIFKEEVPEQIETPKEIELEEVWQELKRCQGLDKKEITKQVHNESMVEIYSMRSPKSQKSPMSWNVDRTSVCTAETNMEQHTKSLLQEEKMSDGIQLFPVDGIMPSTEQSAIHEVQVSSFLKNQSDSLPAEGSTIKRNALTNSTDAQEGEAPGIKDELSWKKTIQEDVHSGTEPSTIHGDLKIEENAYFSRVKEDQEGQSSCVEDEESQEKIIKKEICKEEAPDQVETPREIGSEGGTESKQIFKEEVPEPIETPKEIELEKVQQELKTRQSLDEKEIPYDISQAEITKQVHNESIVEISSMRSPESQKSPISWKVDRTSVYTAEINMEQHTKALLQEEKMSSGIQLFLTDGIMPSTEQSAIHEVQISSFLKNQSGSLPAEGSTIRQNALTNSTDAQEGDASGIKDELRWDLKIEPATMDGELKIEENAYFSHVIEDQGESPYIKDEENQEKTIQDGVSIAESHSGSEPETIHGDLETKVNAYFLHVIDSGKIAQEGENHKFYCCCIKDEENREKPIQDGVGVTQITELETKHVDSNVDDDAAFSHGMDSGKLEQNSTHTQEGTSIAERHNVTEVETKRVDSKVNDNAAFSYGMDSGKITQSPTHAHEGEAWVSEEGKTIKEVMSILERHNGSELETMHVDLKVDEIAEQSNVIFLHNNYGHSNFNDMKEHNCSRQLLSSTSAEAVNPVEDREELLLKESEHATTQNMFKVQEMVIDEPGAVSGTSDSECFNTKAVCSNVVKLVGEQQDLYQCSSHLADTTNDNTVEGKLLSSTSAKAVNPVEDREELLLKEPKHATTQNMFKLQEMIISESGAMAGTSEDDCLDTEAVCSNVVKLVWKQPDLYQCSSNLADETNDNTVREEIQSDQDNTEEEDQSANDSGISGLNIMSNVLEVNDRSFEEVPNAITEDKNACNGAMKDQHVIQTHSSDIVSEAVINVSLDDEVQIGMVERVASLSSDDEVQIEKGVVASSSVQVDSDVLLDKFSSELEGRKKESYLAHICTVEERIEASSSHGKTGSSESPLPMDTVEDENLDGFLNQSAIREEFAPLTPKEEKNIPVPISKSSNVDLEISIASHNLLGFESDAKELTASVEETCFREKTFGSDEVNCTSLLMEENTSCLSNQSLSKLQALSLTKLRALYKKKKTKISNQQASLTIESEISGAPNCQSLCNTGKGSKVMTTPQAFRSNSRIVDQTCVDKLQNEVNHNSPLIEKENAHNLHSLCKKKKAGKRLALHDLSSNELEGRELAPGETLL